MFLALITYADKGNFSKKNVPVEGICVSVTAGERSVFCAKCCLFLMFLVLDLSSTSWCFCASLASEFVNFSLGAMSVSKKGKTIPQQITLPKSSLWQHYDSLYLEYFCKSLEK